MVNVNCNHLHSSWQLDFTKRLHNHNCPGSEIEADHLASRRYTQVRMASTQAIPQAQLPPELVLKILKLSSAKSWHSFHVFGNSRHPQGLQSLYSASLVSALWSKMTLMALRNCLRITTGSLAHKIKDGLTSSGDEPHFQPVAMALQRNINHSLPSGETVKDALTHFPQVKHLLFRDLKQVNISEMIDQLENLDGES